MNHRFIPLLAFTALAIGLWAALSYTPPSSPATASPMPPLPLRSLQDVVEPQWKPKADTVTVVNFFASWCVPCLAEQEQLKNLSKIDGIEIHGIAWNDRPEDLRVWLKENGNPFTTVWRDTTGRAAIAMGLRGVPESFVIDKSGKVRLHVQGTISPAMEARLRELLIDLRDERKSDAPAA